MSTQRIGLSLAAAVAAVVAPTALRAVEITAGDWKLTVSGNVNAHYIYHSCEDNPVAIDGATACVVGPSGEDNASSISTGLLPAALAFTASTTQGGYDLEATFGLFPGISTNDGGSPNLQGTPGPKNTALGTTGLDIRQVYLTFGNKTMGTFMLGRNIGLFQQDAILNDMTLLGVGAGSSNYAAPTNTSLGSIGLGYIYTDWLAQINYTTPDFNGFKFTIGIFDPLEPILETGPTPKGAPGFHGKIAYTYGDLYLSASFLSQQQEGVPVGAIDTDYDSFAFDVGGKYKFGDFEVMAYYYDGSGVGTTGLFIRSSDGLGNERDSDGFLAQVTYTFAGRTKVGVNYGESNLDTASGENNPGLVAKNSKYTLGVYHKLTENLTLVGEFTDMESENQAGGDNSNTTFNLGAFLAF
ncbi:MAG TPA: porin [Steroidobacteraceae bacterium]